MGNSNSRGQGTLDVLILLVALSALLIAALKLSETSSRLIPKSQLSREIR